MKTNKEPGPIGKERANSLSNHTNVSNTEPLLYTLPYLLQPMFSQKSSFILMLKAILKKNVEKIDSKDS